MDKKTNELMKEFFDSKAEIWDDKKKVVPDYVRELFDKYVKRSSRVLDIACGTGIIDKELSLRDPHLVLAIDLSDKMIEKANNKNNCENVEYKVADFYTLDEGKFDLAVMYNSYIHFIYKEELCKKLYETLNENGRFLIINNSDYKVLNKNHQNPYEEKISIQLKSTDEEKEYFIKYFDVDVSITTADKYILSGVKKK